MSNQPPISPQNNTLASALAEHAKTRGSYLTEDDSPHILVLGPSGSGKSRSICNLPPENTIIFNPEGKALPFQNAEKFKDRKLSGFTSVEEINKWFKLAASDPTVKYIIYDSITEYFQLLMKEARTVQKGYEIFNYYNAFIGNFLQDIRKIKNKIVILTGIDELAKIERRDGSMENKRCAWVEGKVWSNTNIESKFSIVLFTDVMFQRESTSGITKGNYRFTTQSDGTNTAKSPEGMFEFYIPNDLAIVVEKVEKYFHLNGK